VASGKAGDGSDGAQADDRLPTGVGSGPKSGIAGAGRQAAMMARESVCAIFCSE